MGTAHILDVARRKRLGRIVIASSTTVGYPVFGSRGPEAIEEDFQMRVIGERPASIYAATKLTGEHLALLHADLYQVDCLCLRYAAVIGGSLEAPTSVPESWWPASPPLPEPGKAELTIPCWPGAGARSSLMRATVQGPMSWRLTLLQRNSVSSTSRMALGRRCESSWTSPDMR